MRPYDEARDAARRPRAHYAEVLEAVAAIGPGALARDAAARARETGIAVGTAPLPVDPVPRVIPAAEWATVATGLAQRARALDALVRASYAGEPGGLPPEILASTPYFECDLVGAPAAGAAIGIVGFDLVRGPDGALRVLEDNVLTPGHVAVPAARELLRLWQDV